MQILGIVNVTRDSFSDGGQHLAPDAALAHAHQLFADGADIIDLGAESTHPDSENVSAQEEIARLTPIIRPLRDAGVRVSVDTYKPQVIREALALGVELINDVSGLRDPEAIAILRDSPARIILMHSTAAGPRAQRLDISPDTITDRVLDFFRRRIDDLESAGIARNRLILDPGMGFFLGRDPQVSLAVLHDLPRLRALGLPLCISTSRKSFIGALLGTADAPRPVSERAPATLATELWAAAHGAEYIRTHAPRPLRDAWQLWQSIEHAPRNG